MTVVKNTHVTNAWHGCNNTIPGDPQTGSCNKTNITSPDYHVCEKLCAEDPRCYSWAWAGNNNMCYTRSDCYWSNERVPNRISGYKGTTPPGTPPQNVTVAVPTPEQLTWMDYEVGAMLGFNLQTICVPKGHPSATTQRCQASSKTEGALYVPNRDAVRAWNPSALDTDEWVKTAASFGAKYIVLVADHMTGFTLWDTSVHNYSIAHTAYKGGGQDVVKDFVASCQKYGVKPGYFYSFHFNWFLGVDGFKVGHPPLGPKSYTQEEYLGLAKTQLEEISGNYGTPIELW
jgi:hypothetical protein